MNNAIFIYFIAHYEAHNNKINIKSRCYPQSINILWITIKKDVTKNNFLIYVDR